MNIIELEEGLRNLITTQPAILSGQHAAVIGGIKNIIEAHKAFVYRVHEYSEQDILKVGLTSETSKVELNLVSYVCQVLQERGINIMLYVPKYAAVYNQEISKYVDNVVTNIKEENTEVEKVEATESIIEPVKKEEKYVVVEKAEPKIEKHEKKVETKKNVQPEKKEQVVTTKSQGRDYLMELLKK